MANRPNTSPNSATAGVLQKNRVQPDLAPDTFFPSIPTTNSPDSAQGTLPPASGPAAPHAYHPDRNQPGPGSGPAGP